MSLEHGDPLAGIMIDNPPDKYLRIPVILGQRSKYLSQ